MKARKVKSKVDTKELLDRIVLVASTFDAMDQITDDPENRFHHAEDERVGLGSYVEYLTPLLKRVAIEYARAVRKSN